MTNSNDRADAVSRRRIELTELLDEDVQWRLDPRVSRAIARKFMSEVAPNDDMALASIVEIYAAAVYAGVLVREMIVTRTRRCHLPDCHNCRRHLDNLDHADAMGRMLAARDMPALATEG